jgi:hypothetical protein
MTNGPGRGTKAKVKSQKGKGEGGAALVILRRERRGLREQSLMKASPSLVITFAFCLFTFALLHGCPCNFFQAST